MAVCTNRYTTTQVADDEVEIFVLLSLLAGKTPGHGALVKGVPSGDARHEGRTGDACHVIQLVRYTRVGNESAAATDTFGQVCGDEATQVAGMRAGSMQGIVQHLCIYLIYATGNWLEQSAATDDSIKLQRNVVGCQFMQYYLLAEVKLVGDVGKGR